MSSSPELTMNDEVLLKPNQIQMSLAVYFCFTPNLTLFRILKSNNHLLK